MILICSFLDSLQTNHIYVVYNIKVIYVISELFNNAVYIHVYEQFVTCDKHDTRIYLNGLSFKYNDSSYLDDIWFEFDAHKQLSYNLNEVLNLTIIELSSDEFKSKYMKMISETESIYDKSEKLIKNLK